MLPLSDTIVRLGGPEFDAFADFLAPSFEEFLCVWELLFYDCSAEWKEGREGFLIDPDATVIVNAGFEEVY
jgi:hypothetical protein